MMSTVDLIILGLVHEQPLSAYDIQKAVNYRNLDRWVKVSTPSIYKKVQSLSQRGDGIDCLCRLAFAGEETPL